MDFLRPFEGNLLAPPHRLSCDVMMSSGAYCVVCQVSWLPAADRINVLAVVVFIPDGFKLQHVDLDSPRCDVMMSSRAWGQFNNS